MIHLEFLRNLRFSASSGLVKIGNSFYSVSDDQLALENFGISENENSTFLPLFPGKLPENPKERKALKPDLEALILIAKIPFFPLGALLALPSGSTHRRIQGALLTLDPGQEPTPALPVDFSNLYQELSSSFSELNIEGACVKGSTLKLFQRGNGASSQNAIIDLNLEAFLQELSGSRKISGKCFQHSNWIELPKLNGNSLGFTDAASISPDPHSPIWFLAAAEKTLSTYEDGPFAGAVLGCMDSNQKLISISQLDCSEKPEGLWIDSENPKDFYVVTDADNPAVPSRLLRGKLPELPTVIED